MSLDLDRIATTINDLWDSYAGVAMILAAVVVLLVVLRIRRQWQLRDFSAKASLGFSAVQIGVTYAVVLGVYEFFGPHVLRLDTFEAIVLAVVAEGTTWAAVGFIARYAKGKDADGKPNEGFGPAGPFFWVTVLGGGTLAIVAAESTQVAIGRAVIVALGAYMWYLRLLQIITRAARTAYAWTWTPTRLLQALGAMEPRTDDAATANDAAREHQIRRLARAIRWANSGRFLRWLGQRSLARRAETVTEDVIGEARRRWAVAFVLRDQSLATSPTMATLIAEIERTVVPGGSPEGDPGTATPEQGSVVPGGVPGDRSPRNGEPARLRRRASSAGGSRGGNATRSPATAGPNMADRIRARAAQSPELSRAELARQVGATDRYVREVLNGASSAPGSAHSSGSSSGNGSGLNGHG